MSEYSCGTCNSDVIVVTSDADSPWKVACENGHEWIPAGGHARIEIDTGVVEERLQEVVAKCDAEIEELQAQVLMHSDEVERLQAFARSYRTWFNVGGTGETLEEAVNRLDKEALAALEGTKK